MTMTMKSLWASSPHPPTREAGHPTVQQRKGRKGKRKAIFRQPMNLGDILMDKLVNVCLATTLTRLVRGRQGFRAYRAPTVMFKTAK